MQIKLPKVHSFFLNKTQLTRLKQKAICLDVRFKKQICGLDIT